MKFNRFNTNIILRITLIIVSGYLLAFLAQKDDMILTSIVLSIMILIQGILLVNYINSVNRNLEAVIGHIIEQDVSINLNQQFLNQNFGKLISQFKNVNKEISELRNENELRKEFVSILIENLNVGVLVYDKNQNISYVNKHVKKYIKSELTRNLSDIQKINPLIYNNILALKSGQKELILVESDKGKLNISLAKNLIKIKDDEINIITFHNVQNEMEQVQIDSWQKLIRVLNHEVMNSITPITSLCVANRNFLRKYLQEENSLELINDIISNNDIIENRSKGLMNFINNYRKITSLPKPDLQQNSIIEIVKNTIQLLKEEFTSNSIEIITEFPNEEIFFKFDKNLIEQTLINLLKNAIESFESEDNRKTEVKIHKSDLNTIIEIADNGRGIEQKNLDKIFVPFFTTKDSGSGIGLSLCRQIMLLHKGTIKVESDVNKGTRFLLEFLND